MNEIRVMNKDGKLTVSSLQVAKDFGKCLSDVHETIENLTAENSVVKNFFIEALIPTNEAERINAMTLLVTDFHFLSWASRARKLLSGN